MSAALLATGLLVGASSVGAAPIDGAATATAAAKRVDNATATKDLPPPPQPQSVRYRVTVISDWTSASHPTTLPSNSHFSPIVLANHGAVGNVFALGAIASPGIEQMAESGSTSTLRSELLSNDLVRDVQVGASVFGAGSNVFDVTAFQADDLITVVTMLAPSPDWFVGVRDIELFVDGEWVDRIELDLQNYDAGTDSGASFRSPNVDTNPAQVISRPRDATFLAAAAEGRFGRLVVERI